MEEVDFTPLNLLLKAPSKDVVDRLCNEAFLCQNCKIPASVIKASAQSLSIENSEAKQVLCSLCALIKNAIFKGSTEAKIIISLFPDKFHKNLRDLLAKIIVENLPKWHSHAITNMVSLPRLVDFDWRVDVKSSADSIARMSVPTCILQLQVEEEVKTENKVADVSVVNVELSKETLDTMLDGLGKIRDQLSSVTNR